MLRATEPIPTADDFEERRFRALASIAAAVAAAHELDDVLELAAEETRDVLHVSSLSISRWQVEQGILQTLINVGDLAPGEDRHPTNETYPLSDFPLAFELLRNGRPHITTTDDPHAEPAELALLAHLGKSSCVAVPIVYEGQTWGEMYVTRASGASDFDAVEVQFIQAICSQLALAIGRAELFSQLVMAAYRDPLTGLANRRAFDERLGRELEPEAPVGVALLLGDLDGLKARNDSAGHEAGDLALRLVGHVLQEACGSDMLAARVGGDEFGVILATGGMRSAQELSIEVDRRLAAADRGIAVSWGAAEYVPGVAGPGDLLRAADAVLYACKSERKPSLPARSDRPAPDRRRRRSGTFDDARAVLEFMREGLALLDGPVERSSRERCLAIGRLTAEHFPVDSSAATDAISLLMREAQR